MSTVYMYNANTCCLPKTRIRSSSEHAWDAQLANMAISAIYMADSLLFECTSCNCSQAKGTVTVVIHVGWESHAATVRELLVAVSVWGCSGDDRSCFAPRIARNIARSNS
eukprot:1632-Heterococcus_DN1.PRE.4